MAQATCSHIDAIIAVNHAKHRQCDECVKMSGTGFICGSVRSAARPAVAMTRRTAKRPRTRAQANTP